MPKVLILVLGLLWAIQGGTSGVTEAHRLVNEVKGVQVDPQAFVWKASAIAPKTIDLVSNPFFKVKMPKNCYELSPNGGGDDISESLGLVIERLKKCPSYVGEEELPNFFYAHVDELVHREFRLS